jgi:hypothetical protein
MNITFSFTSSITSFEQVSPSVPVGIFMYQYRGAFMGDVTCNRNENPYFYKYSTYATNSISTPTISFITYPNQTYYLNIRPDTISSPRLFVNVVPWFSSSFQVTSQSLDISSLVPATDILQSNFSTLINTNFNYAQVYDSNWIQLPIQNYNSTTTSLSDFSGINSSDVPIGYDTNGISTDYTDYIPFLVNSRTDAFYPSNMIAIDPINQYIFHLNSPYNTTTDSYIYQYTNNSIFSPGFSNNYLPTTVSKREYKIAHYYSVNFIPESLKNITYYEPRYILNDVYDATNHQLNTSGFDIGSVKNLYP